MLKNTIIDNEFITLWYHPIEKIIHHQFHKKTIYGQIFRDALNTGAEILKENSACKWLSDDRTHIIFSEEDLVWGSKEWAPKVFGYGWKYWAMVRPTEQIGRMNFERITHEFKSRGLTIEYFDDVEKAFEWLCKCK